jgi:hypothetical protein
LSDFAAEKQNDMYTRWNHAATAGGFIVPRAIAPGCIAPSASLPLTGVKFVPHNTPAFPITQILRSHFTASGKVTDRRVKRKGYTSEAL